MGDLGEARKLNSGEKYRKRVDLKGTGPFSLTALELLASIPVDGTEEDRLVSEFAETLDAMIGDEKKQYSLVEKLMEINPNYQPKIYSQDTKANILANVVAAIYAPLIHAFTGSVLKNIQAGILSPVIIAPPRDAIPFANSIKALAEIKGIPIKVIDLQVTRIIAGIGNQQASKGKVAMPDPLLAEYVYQELSPYLEYGFTEIEPGIYSTTSMMNAELAAKMGNVKYAAFKLYGLGQNLSFTHALLSGGQEWIAENAEAAGLVNTQQIADLMTLLDSTEEFGMQHMHASVCKLFRDENGLIQPFIEDADPDNYAIAVASNLAVTDTAQSYSDDGSLKTACTILSKFKDIIELSKQGYPLSLTNLIPPGKTDGKKELFEKIRQCTLLYQPTGLTL